jgi:hypothetical protein
MKKYTSLEHTIKKVVAEQNYTNKPVDEAISPVDYDKPKEVPQAFFKPVHIQPRKGEAQIPAGGSTRSRRNVEKEKSSETMHPDLKEEAKKKEPNTSEDSDKLDPNDPEPWVRGFRGANVASDVLKGAVRGYQYVTNPENLRRGLYNIGVIKDTRGPETPEEIKKSEEAGRAARKLSTYTAPLLTGLRIPRTPRGAKPPATATTRTLELPGATIETPRPGVSTKADATPAANAPAAAPAAARVARTTPRDVTRQSFRNFLKKQEPSKTLELPGATISAPRTGVSTGTDTGPAANINRKLQTPETMGIIVKKQDIPGRTPSANENIPASEFTPPTPKGTGTEGLAPAPRANPKDRPRLKSVPKEKPKPEPKAEPKAEPEPVAPPKIKKPDKTPTGETVRLPGVEITAPTPGVSVPITIPRPSKEQDNAPEPAAAPATTPATTPAASPAAAPAQQPSPGATPGQNIQIVPAPRQNAKPNKATSTRAAEKGKEEGSTKQRRRLRLPPFGFGSGTDSPTPSMRGGYQVSGTASRARSRIEFKEEMSRNDIEAVARKNTKRTDPVVGRPDSDRSKTMSRNAQIISKIIEDKKIIIKKEKEKNLGANPLVDTEPKLNHHSLDQK